MPDWRAIYAALQRDGIAADPSEPPHPLSGGDIDGAWRMTAHDAGRVFLKTAGENDFERLDAEAEGLEALAAAGALRVPRVLSSGVAGGNAFLALEWLELQPVTPEANRKLGRRLASLHRQTNERFGWHRDNTIGPTPQVNTPAADWLGFFREHRLRFQFELAARNGYGGALQAEGRALQDGLDRLFEGYRPPPALLHGDLWGGNWAAVDGEPAVFDPAVHYGDRECDLAMTRLFGGFGREFYAAYEDAWPLEPGHDRRLPLYQLYHLLNHLNLFGRAYLSPALSRVRKLRGQLT